MADFKQIAQLVNDTTKEVIGESATLISEDLSNVTDAGKEILGSDDANKWLQNFVDRIGRVKMYDRVYSSDIDLGIYRDNMEYGTMLQRYMIDVMPDAEDNKAYELEDGVSVDQFVVKLPKASARYFNKRNTWEIDMTILDKQYRSAFTSASALGSFVGMVFNAVENSRTLKIEALSMSIIRNMIATTLKKNFPDGTYTGTSISAVNLLKEYNDEFGTSLTVTDAMHTAQFLKFASKVINEYVRAIKKMSTLYNVEGAARFTPADKQRLVLLGRFVDSAQFYLDADTFNETLVKLPQAQVIDSFQATGKDRGFDKLSAINVKTADGDLVTATGILGILYDTDGAGITCENYRTLTAPYNAKGEYQNYFFKADFASVIFKDMNCVVFFVA